MTDKSTSTTPARQVMETKCINVGSSPSEGTGIATTQIRKLFRRKLNERRLPRLMLYWLVTTLIYWCWLFTQSKFRCSAENYSNEVIIGEFQ